LYICDFYRFHIQKITLQGEVSVFASSTELGGLRGIAMNQKNSTLFVATYTSIYKVSASGEIDFFVGNEKPGCLDGSGTVASFNGIEDIAIDPQSGVLFASDYQNQLIRKISPKGEVTTLAGSKQGFTDGYEKMAKFNGPSGLCYDHGSQSLLVCDHLNNKIRRVKMNGDVSTVCEVPLPTSIAIGSNKKMLISSRIRHIYKATPLEKGFELAILAGTGKEGNEDGAPNKCSFNYPCGIVLHEPSHSCFVADYYNNVIRQINF